MKEELREMAQPIAICIEDLDAAPDIPAAPGIAGAPGAPRYTRCVALWGALALPVILGAWVARRWRRRT